MRVLMLGWELPPHNSGGLGVACFQLCKSLAKNNVDIDFVLPYKTDQENDFMKIHSTTPMHFSKLKNHLNAYDGMDYLSSHAVTSEQLNYEHFVAEKAKENEYDIIHAHDWLTFRAAMKAKQATNLPLIVHVHSIESDRSGGESGNPIIRDIERLGLMMADKVIAVSELTKQAIIKEYGVPEENIEVVHNSMNLEDIIPLSGNNSYRYIELLKSQGYRIVVNFGRLTIQKGLPGLIQAFSKVVKVHPKAILLIIGSGEQYFELIKLSTDLGVGHNVLFTEFQRGKQLRDGIAIGDLFVMPSISEPFGLTALEAIGYGTPALVSKQSGVSEIMNNILKVDFWDIDEMANIIASALENPALLDNLKENSMKELNHISWNDSVQKIKNLYDLQLGATV